ncbi:MAG: transglutaminase family protein [Alphaproteobacteria bacterium]|nr:transglutaminase family protein [Alphaproteobacteria bacterium]
MKITIRHQTRYAYSPPAGRAALRLRLFPPQFDTQQPLGWTVTVNGQPVAPLHTAAFGEQEAVWSTREPQTELLILAAGVVDAKDGAGVVRGLQDYARPGVFLRATSLTAIDRALSGLAQEARCGSSLDTLHALCGLVADRVAYQPRKTHSQTTAAEALAQGYGVCQDHAHVFIATARSIGIPARYVMGYMAAEEDFHETHAWAEAFVPELAAWVGFDPANRRCPTDAYVRLGCGFDAEGAAPIRGCVGPGSKETLTAAVDIALCGAQEQ